ncbi:MAG: FxsA family protein [Candidatus Riflebacteria bacterium]|nr:FxsA family protein [Candidatus Riflebacteria bacterium]
MGCIFQFFLLVTFFSVSEVYLLLLVAQHTGLLFTMACCVFTGIVGGYFVRQQGMQTLVRIRQTLEGGALPADEAVEGLLLLIVGVLLCVPGFITDTLGFLIIVPAIRNFVARRLVKRFKAGIDTGQFKVYTSGSSVRQDPGDHRQYDEPARPAESEIENATIVDQRDNDEKP